MIGRLIDTVIGRLRYPHLFLLTATLFVLDLLIPDLLPFADEVLLALATTLLATLRERKAPREPDEGEPERKSG